MPWEPDHRKKKPDPDQPTWVPRHHTSRGSAPEVPDEFGLTDAQASDLAMGGQFSDELIAISRGSDDKASRLRRRIMDAGPKSGGLNIDLRSLAEREQQERIDKVGRVEEANKFLTSSSRGRRVVASGAAGPLRSGQGVPGFDIWKRDVNERGLTDELVTELDFLASYSDRVLGAGADLRKKEAARNKALSRADRSVVVQAGAIAARQLGSPFEGMFGVSPTAAGSRLAEAAMGKKFGEFNRPDPVFDQAMADLPDGVREVFEFTETSGNILGMGVILKPWAKGYKHGLVAMKVPEKAAAHLASAAALSSFSASHGVVHGLSEGEVGKIDWDAVKKHAAKGAKAGAIFGGVTPAADKFMRMNLGNGALGAKASGAFGFYAATVSVNAAEGKPTTKKDAMSSLALGLLFSGKGELAKKKRLRVPEVQDGVERPELKRTGDRDRLRVPELQEGAGRPELKEMAPAESEAKPVAEPAPVEAAPKAREGAPAPVEIKGTVEPIEGMPGSFKIRSGGGEVVGHRRGADFPGDVSAETRGEVFFVKVPEGSRRKGTGSSLFSDALRLMRSEGAETVVLRGGFSPAGKALVAKMESDGLLGRKIREAETGTVEYELPKPAGAREGAPGRGEGAKVEPKPAAEPAPAVEGEAGGGFRIVNREVNERRRLRGDEPLTEEAPITLPQRRAEAARRIKEDAGYPERLVEELNKTGRGHDNVEAEVLLAHQKSLTDRFKAEEAAGVKAAEAGNKDAAAAANARAEEIRAEHLLAEQASKGAGREVARGLQARKAEANLEDYSQLGVEMSMRRTNDYEPLTPEQKAKAKDLSARMAKAEAKLDRATEAEAMKGAEPVLRQLARSDAPSSRSKEYGAENKTVTKEHLDAANERLRKRGFTTSALLDPTVAKDLAVIGAYHLEAGARTFGRWSKEMVRALGDKVTPHLRQIWEASNKTLASGIRRDITKGESEISPKMVKDLARVVISEGVTEKHAIVDSVHSELKSIDPGITRTETIDALSNYGKVTALSKDPVAVELRRVQAELREVRKLQDLAEGKPPLRTGREPEAPGSEQRELRRQVEEKKREGGYVVTNPQRQLRTALDPVKKRLENEISDLNEEIRTRKRKVSSGPKTPLKHDPESRALLARRNELRKVRDDLFGPRKLTDEQRLSIAIKSAEKALEESKRRVREMDLFPEKKPSLTPPSEKLDALRAENEAVREELKALQLAARPKKTREEVVNQTRLTSLTRQVADLNRQLADPNLTPKSKKPPVEPSQAVTEARAERDFIKMQVSNAVIEKAMRERTKMQKARDAILRDAPGAIKGTVASTDMSFMERQSFFQFMGHPIRTLRGLPSAFRSAKSVAPEGATMAERIFKREAPQQVLEETRIKERENYKQAVESGTDFADHGKQTLAKQTEEFQGRFVRHIPIVAASGRLHTTGLNRVRMDAWDGLAHAFGRNVKPTSAEAKIISNFVNVTTGRPSVGHGKLANALAALGPIAWAPRLVYSRFQALLGQPIWTPKGGYRNTKRVRALIAFEYARSLAGLAMVYALADKAGAVTPFTEGSDTADPRSPDFGKIRVGNTRIDPLAGLSQATVVLTKLITGDKKSRSGDVVSLGVDRPYKGDTRGTVIGTFMRSKLGPLPGTGLDVAIGENMVGEDARSAGFVARNLAVPLSMRDIHESMVEQGVPKGVALGMLAMLGLGVQNYSDNPKKDKKRVKFKR